MVADISAQAAHAQYAWVTGEAAVLADMTHRLIVSFSLAMPVYSCLACEERPDSCPDVHLVKPYARKVDTKDAATPPSVNRTGRLGSAPCMQPRSWTLLGGSSCWEDDGGHRAALACLHGAADGEAEHNRGHHRECKLCPEGDPAHLHTQTAYNMCLSNQARPSGCSERSGPDPPQEVGLPI